MRETERLERKFEVTVRWVAEEELAAVKETTSSKHDCPTTKKWRARECLILREE